MADLGPEREQELFHACLELPLSERGAYLDMACRDDARLRDRIERLLAAHERAERAAAMPLAPIEPDVIGPYRIVRVLGEGGMGVVYEAQQLAPVERRVALKIVKLGLDTRQVLARFALERQVLAAMDHPYIAAVFDAGQTASGRPYFVMELVNGVPLMEYCDRNTLPVQARIDLFVLICQAVQHSHQKGVIHRDLKPSNILVNSGSGAPIPKIIDFGIAKAVGQDGAAATALTRAEQALGTPAYMSPEQVGNSGLDVDTRADVYSLGVILYELLSGSLPVDPAGTSQAEYLALLAKGELRPRRPSTRVTAAEAAQRRGTTAGVLRRQLEGDLDWIVMKALDTDRERRYPTAIALAEDLQRYLKREPVGARPPTLSYRAGKLIRRNRVQVTASALAMLALLGGAAAAGVGFLRASRAEQSARAEAAGARAVSEFLVRLFSLAHPNEAPVGSITVRELLERGVSRVDSELKGQPRTQSNLLGTLSQLYGSLGKYPEARTLAEKALRLERSAGLPDDLKSADTWLSLGRADQRLGEFEPALKALRRALEIRLRLQAENTLQTATVLNNLGGACSKLKRYEEAAAAHRRALAIQRRVAGPDHIGAFNSLRGIGVAEEGKGNQQAALESFQAAYSVARNQYGEEHPLVGDALNNMARVLRSLHRLDEARELSERALRIQQRLLGSNHPHVAFTCHNLGRVLEEQGRLKDALAMYQQGLRIVSTAYGPDNLRTGEILASLGRLRARTGNLDQARQLLARSLEIYRRTYGPSHPETLASMKQLRLVELQAAQRSGPLRAGR